MCIRDRFCNHYAPCREVWQRGEKVNRYIGYDAGEVKRYEPVSYTHLQSGAKYGIYRYEQPPLAKQGIVLNRKGLDVANAFAARRLGLYPCGLIPYQPGEMCIRDRAITEYRMVERIRAGIIL